MQIKNLFLLFSELSILNMCSILTWTTWKQLLSDKQLNIKYEKRSESWIITWNLSSYLTVDCWDGKDGEPVVYHGYTMTSKVKFRYVILNINDFAFLNNK